MLTASLLLTEPEEDKQEAVHQIKKVKKKKGNDRHHFSKFVKLI
jgi:nitrate reductase assembly molybdenum cofactor insertion protein NarJ